MNSSVPSSSLSWSSSSLCLASGTCFPVPFYYTPSPSLLPSIPDVYLTVAAPFIGYWSLSLLFHFFDTRPTESPTWGWLEKYRIHPPAEITKRNTVTKTSVVWMVLLQQFIQTVAAILWIGEEKRTTPLAAYEGVMKMQQLLGTESLAYFAYWWAIPGSQLLCGMMFIDTWEYFLHRTMHTYHFLYKHLHSWHHRLYVPYAFGALYNHPVEGFILDTVGAVLAEATCRMSTRQAMFLFTFATMKTVDDHCGYSLPWDPFQIISSNTAAYHDIHHQVIGIKSNFAQPFFIHWDILLGTRMTRKEMEEKRSKNREKAKVL